MSQASWVRGPPVRMHPAQSRFEIKWSGETAVRDGPGTASAEWRGSMIRHDFFQGRRETSSIVDLPLTMIEDRLGGLAVAAVGGAELLTTGDVAALRTAVDLATVAISSDEEESMASPTTTDCLAEDCRGLILHEAPRIVEIRDRRWQNSSIVFCASETELQSVAPVVDAAGAIYFSARTDHIRGKSGMKRALQLESETRASGG